MCRENPVSGINNRSKRGHEDSWRIEHRISRWRKRKIPSWWPVGKERNFFSLSIVLERLTGLTGQLPFYRDCFIYTLIRKEEENENLFSRHNVHRRKVDLEEIRKEELIELLRWKWGGKKCISVKGSEFQVTRLKKCGKGATKITITRWATNQAEKR